MSATNIPGNDSWFDRHPVLTLVVLLAGAALLLWFLFFRKGEVKLAAPAAPIPQSLVSVWSPLQ
jgi:hypothetical protein